MWDTVQCINFGLIILRLCVCFSNRGGPQTDADVVLANLYVDLQNSVAGAFVHWFAGDGKPSNPFGESTGDGIMTGGSFQNFMEPGMPYVNHTAPMALRGNLFVWSCAMPISGTTSRCVDT